MQSDGVLEVEIWQAQAQVAVEIWQAQAQAAVEIWQAETQARDQEGAMYSGEKSIGRKHGMAFLTEGAQT
jgi:uncharacterized protein YuzE